jgi:hypothetical protein
LIGAGLGVVSDLDLAGDCAVKGIELLLEVVSDPLVDDRSLGELGCGQLDGEVEEPSVFGTLGAVELVASGDALEAAASRGVTEEVAELELEPLVEVSDSLSG